MDRCATFRTALDSISLISQGEKNKTLLASVLAARAVCYGKSRCQIKLLRVKGSTRTELLLCLGCSNTTEEAPQEMTFVG